MVNHQYAAVFLRDSLRKAARFSTVFTLALALLVFSAQHAAAQGATEGGEQPLVVELEQFKVVENDDGEEQLVEAENVRPGDVIEYRVTYRNRGTTEIADLIAVLPIPGETAYQANSAAPPGFPAEAATEDGEYGPEPLVRLVRQADGELREEPVPYAEYRSLRWAVGDLSPGHEIVVKARVEVAPLESQVSDSSSPVISSAALSCFHV